MTILGNPFAGMIDAFGNEIPELPVAHICPSCNKPWGICECEPPQKETLFDVEATDVP